MGSGVHADHLLAARVSVRRAELAAFSNPPNWLNSQFARRGRVVLADARPWVLPQATSANAIKTFAREKCVRMGGRVASKQLIAIVDPNSVNGI